jgi:hypothetical protein
MTALPLKADVAAEGRESPKLTQLGSFGSVKVVGSLGDLRGAVLFTLPKLPEVLPRNCWAIERMA